MPAEAVCADLVWWKEFGEIVANFATMAAFLVAAVTFYKWRSGRYDRATEVLFKLHDRFDSEEVRRARRQLEDDAEYDRIRESLAIEAADPKQPAILNSGQSRSQLDDLDELLRFYVLLCSVRLADQVRNESLSTSFRFWLAHYHHPGRKEFRRYVDAFFPTLRRWMEDDRELRWQGLRGFFVPQDFGWKDDS